MIKKNAENAANVRRSVLEALSKKMRMERHLLSILRIAGGCCSCIKECQFDAIGLYLGADIGGMGSSMTVKSRDHFLDWNIHKTDGSTETIVIDKKESNKY